MGFWTTYKDKVHQQRPTCAIQASSKDLFCGPVSIAALYQR